jgi:hypothetical protein
LDKTNISIILQNNPKTHPKVQLLLQKWGWNICFCFSTWYLMEVAFHTTYGPIFSFSFFSFSLTWSCWHNKHYLNFSMKNIFELKKIKTCFWFCNFWWNIFLGFGSRHWWSGWSRYFGSLNVIVWKGWRWIWMPVIDA